MALIFQEVTRGARHDIGDMYWRTTPDAPQKLGERSRANLDAWCTYWNASIEGRGGLEHYIVVDSRSRVVDCYTPSLF